MLKQLSRIRFSNGSRIRFSNGSRTLVYGKDFAKDCRKQVFFVPIIFYHSSILRSFLFMFWLGEEQQFWTIKPVRLETACAASHGEEGHGTLEGRLCALLL